MTRENPQGRLKVEPRARKPAPVLAVACGNFADSPNNQHRRQWQLRTAGKHFTAAASKQILKFKARTSILHTKSVLAAVRGLTQFHSLTYCPGWAKMRGRSLLRRSVSGDYAGI